LRGEINLQLAAVVELFAECGINGNYEYKNKQK